MYAIEAPVAYLAPPPMYAPVAYMDPGAMYAMQPALSPDMPLFADYGSSLMAPALHSLAPMYGSPFGALGPPAPGNRRALLIGINYTGTRSQLRGCHQDVERIRTLLLSLGWQPSEIVVVTDSPRSPVQPTYDGLLAAFRWLSSGTRPGDVRFLHFSGHGGMLPATAQTLKPGPLEQTMIPVDHANGRRQIRGHLIFSELVAPLPPGSRLTVVMDCCHSGAVLDLPYQFVAHQFEMTKYFQNGRRMPGSRPFRTELDKSRPLTSGLRLIPQMLVGRLESVLDGPLGGGPEGWKVTGAPGPAADVLMLSSCKDWQLSADIRSSGAQWELPDGKGGFTGGALTYALLAVLGQTVLLGVPISLLELLERMRQLIRSRNLMQVPQLGSSAILDLDAPFDLEGPLLPDMALAYPSAMMPMAYAPW